MRSATPQASYRKDACLRAQKCPYLTIGNAIRWSMGRILRPTPKQVKLRSKSPIELPAVMAVSYAIALSMARLSSPANHQIGPLVRTTKTCARVNRMRETTNRVGNTLRAQEHNHRRERQ